MVNEDIKPFTSTQKPKEEKQIYFYETNKKTSPKKKILQVYSSHFALSQSILRPTNKLHNENLLTTIQPYSRLATKHSKEKAETQHNRKPFPYNRSNTSPSIQVQNTAIDNSFKEKDSIPTSQSSSQHNLILEIKNISTAALKELKYLRQEQKCLRREVQELKRTCVCNKDQRIPSLTASLKIPSLSSEL